MWGRPGHPFLSAILKCDTILTSLCARVHQLLCSHTNVYFVHACLLTDHNCAKIDNHISMGILDASTCGEPSLAHSAGGALNT